MRKILNRLRILSLVFFLFNNLFLGYSKTYAEEKDPSLENFRKAAAAFMSGDYDSSLFLFNSVLEDRTNRLGANSTSVANVLVNLGVIKSHLGLYDNAIELYKRAGNIYQNSGMSFLVKLATVHQNLAICYMENGDVENALLYFENAERLYSENLALQSYEYESLLINLTIFNYEVDLLSKAFASNAKSFNLTSIFKVDYRKWSSKGMIYFKMKDYCKSLECFNNALLVGEKDHGPNFSGKELILQNISMAQMKLGDFESSIKSYNQALLFISKNIGSRSPFYSNCLTELGQVYLQKSEAACNIDDYVADKRRNIETALNYFQDALKAISPEFNVSSWSENPDISNTLDKTKLLSALKSKADALRILADLESKSGHSAKALQFRQQSLSTFELATKVIHLIRTGFMNQESRLKLAENEHPVYIGAVDVASMLYELTSDQHYFEKAFEFSERSRSTDFQTMIRNSHARDIGGLPDSLLQKEKELKSEIAAYESFVFQENSSAAADTAKVAMWKDKIFTLKKSYDDLVKLFERAYPSYYQFKYSDKMVSVREIQNKLNSREAMIEYFIKDQQNGEPKELFAFLIQKNSFQLLRQPIDSTFDNTITRFLGFIRNGAVAETRKKDYIQYITDGVALNSWLIKPFNESIKNSKLVIVPDDKLAYVPFDAFVAQMPDTTKMDFRGIDYLVYHHPVSYTYSATLLYYYFQNARKATKSIAAFAPNYDGTDIELNSIRNIVPRDRLFPLPGAQKEVEGVTNIIEGDVFAGDIATEQQFKNVAGDYDILHLAMHTILNDSLPMYSKLVFTSEAAQNGLLDTHEIYNLDLNARMAVLSACNTGSGRLQRGEGVMSLARAFLYSGCPSIVMTLWNVEDISSAELMIHFYENLYSGFSKDEALQKAKLTHIANADPLKAHPYYWLGYVSVGSQEPLFRSNYLLVGGMSLVVLLAILLERGFRNRHKKRSQKV